LFALDPYRKPPVGALSGMSVMSRSVNQWFGNLVTTEFWTELWLKEGVARYLDFVGIDSIFLNGMY